MRIGLISGEYPPDQGGVGDFTRELARSLADIGHETHVITNASGKLQVASCKSQVASRKSLSVHRVMSGWGWGCWGQALTLAQDLSLDVLNVQYQAAAYDMHPAINFVPHKKNRPPVVVTFHDLKVPYLFPKAGPLRRWVVRLLARRADGVIVTNEEDAKKVASCKFQLSNLALIPIGSNIPVAPPPGYNRDVERAKWGVGTDDLLLGYFGFLNESKGGEELMQTLALLVEQGSPAHLLMIGGRVGSSDPSNRAYAERVENLIASLGLSERVHWSGYARPDKVSAGLLAADVCVLPYRDGVSFRRGTLHACLTHGRAIVTTHPAVELPQVRDGENMLLAEPRDTEELAQTVARLAADPALRTRLEAGAKALAAEFTWERIARQTAAFFRRL
ncbi:MAG: glycosyltransferase family 4 protein [Chloroflexota bacterium]|nr:glycosyltransferase family 4 protein [Chloroflexota bacterium]